jgi:hypothetical protein
MRYLHNRREAKHRQLVIEPVGRSDNISSNKSKLIDPNNPVLSSMVMSSISVEGKHKEMGRRDSVPHYVRIQLLKVNDMRLF